MIQVAKKVSNQSSTKSDKELTVRWISSKEQMLPSHLRLALVDLSNNLKLLQSYVLCLVPVSWVYHEEQ